MILDIKKKKKKKGYIEGKVKVLTTLEDMPRYREKMERIDKNRISRLKEAKDTRNFKQMILMWANDRMKVKVLSEKQRLAIHFLTDFTQNHSNEWVMAKINVDRKTFMTWRNDPLFIREMDKEITRRKSFLRLPAFRNVARAVARGSIKDSWKVLQMTGDLKENIEVNDRTGEKEMDENQLNEHIELLTRQLAGAHTPSMS